METKKSPPLTPLSKRPRTDEQTSTAAPSTTVSPKFLIIHATQEDRNLSKVSPFLVEKALYGLAGTVTSVKKLRSGDLLIETATPAQSQSLLKSTLLADIPISVTPHKTLNSSRGVISTPDLVGVSEEELVTELSSQGVTAAKRIYIKRDGKSVETQHVILTFTTPTLPSHIKAGYLRCPLRKYIPNPLRCFKCQRFGHAQTSCRGSPACAKCGSIDHIDSDCTSPPSCVNCKNPHPAYARSCPRWKEEKEIQALRTNDNLSYAEAKRRLLPQSSRPSYASIASATQSASTVSTKTTASQTDMSIPPSTPSKPFAAFLTKPKPQTSKSDAATSTSATSPAKMSPTKSPVPPKQNKPALNKPKGRKANNNKFAALAKLRGTISDCGDCTSDEMELEGIPPIQEPPSSSNLKLKRDFPPPPKSSSSPSPQ